MNLKRMPSSSFTRRTHQSEYIQDFHGPHCSPEKQFQTHLNKASYKYTTLIREKKN